MDISILHDEAALNVGRYDVWILNTIKLLGNKVGILTFPNWVESESFESTGERFGILPSSELLRAHLLIKPCSPTNLSYICRKMNTLFAVLPVHTNEEKKDVSQSYMTGENFRPVEWAKKWNAVADGLTVYYKYPEHLTKYKTKVFDRLENCKKLCAQDCTGAPGITG